MVYVNKSTHEFQYFAFFSNIHLYTFNSNIFICMNMNSITFIWITSWFSFLFAHILTYSHTYCMYVFFIVMFNRTAYISIYQFDLSFYSIPINLHSRGMTTKPITLRMNVYHSIDTHYFFVLFVSIVFDCGVDCDRWNIDMMKFTL